MAFVNNYPYTDMHELNLDWVIEEIGKTKVLNNETKDMLDEVKDDAERADLAANNAETSANNAEISAASARTSAQAVSSLTSQVATNTANISVNSARIDEFASLPEGSTSGNAELVDIRVGYDGQTYTTAGNAVRGQVSALADTFNGVVNVNTTNIVGRVFDGKYFDPAAYAYKTDSRFKTIFMYVNPGDSFMISGISCIKDEINTRAFLVVSKNNDILDGSVITEQNVYLKSKNHIVTMPENAFMMFCCGSDELGELPSVKLLHTNSEYIDNVYKVDFSRGDNQYITPDETPAAGTTETYNCICAFIPEFLYGRVININSFGWNPAYYNYDFRDRYGNSISHGTANGAYNGEITVPSAASYMYVNGVIAGSINVIANATTKPSQYKGNTIFNGKRVVWFGTSIPEGKVNGKSYPEMIAERLGFTLFNESLGASPMSDGVPINESRLRALSLTYAEKQSKSWWSELSAADKELAKVSSLDYKFDKYLTGGEVGPVDIYVFDHCYNDYYYLAPDNYSIDPEDAGDAYNKSYCVGAANFLINRILNDNPRAKILWIGHYENALLDPTNKQSWGKPVAEVQKYITTKYGIPLCETWAGTGWSNNHKITTSGYWNDNNWIASGGAVRQDYVKNCQFADGIHPHTDGSGESTAKIADIITAFFTNTYSN